MGHIYNLPQQFESKLPKISLLVRDRNQYQAEEDAFINELAEFCKKRNPNNLLGVGEVIQFPVADGYAMYMVAGLKPVELIHLPLMDAWNYEYAHRLTKKDIVEKIANQKALSKLFK